METRDLVTVYTVTQPIEAELIRNVLHDEGIEAFVSGEGQAGLTGILDIQILVPAEDCDRAARLIEDIIELRQSYQQVQESHPADNRQYRESIQARVAEFHYQHRGDRPK